jgi:transcriptional regulator with XRE-family HTH domain
MPTGDTPVSNLRRLRGELRQQRDALQLTQKEVAEALDWSPSKLIRIERGPVGISVTDVRALLQHYRVTDTARVDALVDMARASKKPAWWHKYREFYSPQFISFIGLEASSTRVRQYQGLVVPGLLQQRDYGGALIGSRTSDPQRVERALDVRMSRQQLLERDGHESYFILDESVLYRMLGSPEVMRAQLRHLIELGSRPNVKIQVVPFSVGPHKGMKSSFELLEMSDSQDDYAVLLEAPYEDHLVEDTSEETREYVNIFLELQRIALSPADSVTLIERVIEATGDPVMN